jgi:tripartite-type tricarboxylate transporter receptor subunit TctC
MCEQRMCDPARPIGTGLRAVLVLLAGVTVVAAQSPSQGSNDASSYPAHTIRYIVPYPPGGFNDTLGRIVSQKLQEAWGQPVVVDNRPGGGTLTGTDAAAKSAPDGYTLLGVAFPFGANPSIYRKLPYDTVADFSPVMLAGRTPNLLAVRPSLPVQSVKDLIAHAKANAGKVSFGSAGTGSSNHLSMELFKSMAGVEMVHVPYKGSAPMLNDLLGGHIDAVFDNTPNVLPQVQSGALRALAISSAQRSVFAPDIPTVAEAGLPGYAVDVWFGIVAPARTPPDIVSKLNAQLNTMLALPEVRRQFQSQGVEPVGGTPEQLGTHIAAEIDKWARVVKEAGIKPE